jgi:hypothetical protein
MVLETQTYFLYYRNYLVEFKRVERNIEDMIVASLNEITISFHRLVL